MSNETKTVVGIEDAFKLTEGATRSVQETATVVVPWIANNS